MKKLLVLFQEKFSGQKMEQWQTVKATYSEEELANIPEEDHDHGEHFVMIEEWESIQDRINFGRSMSKEHHMKVIPYLLPNHSHEFYEAL